MKKILLIIMIVLGITSMAYGNSVNKIEKELKITYMNDKLDIKWDIPKNIYEKIEFEVEDDSININYVPKNKKIKKESVLFIWHTNQKEWEEVKDGNPCYKIYDKGDDRYTVTVGSIGENPYYGNQKYADEYDYICNELEKIIKDIKIKGVPVVIKE